MKVVEPIAMSERMWMDAADNDQELQF